MSCLSLRWDKLDGSNFWRGKDISSDRSASKTGWWNRTSQPGGGHSSEISPWKMMQRKGIVSKSFIWEWKNKYLIRNFFTSFFTIFNRLHWLILNYHRLPFLPSVGNFCQLISNGLIPRWPSTTNCIVTMASLASANIVSVLANNNFLNHRISQG